MYFTICFFILGLLFGSFYNVCIFRIPRGEDIFISRSHCTSCNHLLGPLDLVPVFSYLFLGGKCRYCKTPFSMRYLLIELLTGMLFAYTYHITGLQYLLIPRLAIVSLLIIIAFIDLDHMIIPHSLTITGMVTALGWQVYSHHLTWASLIWGFILGFGLPFVFVIFGGMGGGDAMLGGMFGLYFGLKHTFVLLMLSFIIGGSYSIFVLVTQRRKRNEKLPFGPFLAIAGVLMLFWGVQFAKLYGL